MKKRNDDLVAVGGKNAGAGTQSVDDGAIEANAITKNKRKKSIKVASADSDATSDDTSTDDSAGAKTTSDGAKTTKKKLKKSKKKARDASPTTSEVADSKANSNHDAKRRRENVFLSTLEAINDDDHDGHDAQSVGSASNAAAMVSGQAMRSIKAVPDMRDKAQMDNYLTEVRNAVSSVTDSSALRVKNLIGKFNDRDAKDLRLAASYKIDLDICSIDEYLAFLKELSDGWHSRSNNENELSSLVNSVSFDNLLSTNMRGETSKNYIVHILFEIETKITNLCTELGQLNSEKKKEIEMRMIQILYDHLEMQIRTSRRKDAATLWECLQKVKSKSSIKENIDNLAEL